tara:strand:- start:748 stop:1047 length:300 start_codon:yes stop_codon:yes gene_type:complete
MENLIEDLKDIMWDVKQAEGRAGDYKKEIDRGINANHVAPQEGERMSVTIESLFEYLIDAKHDMDRVKDSFKDILEKMEVLVENMEYESTRQKAVRERG